MYDVSMTSVTFTHSSAYDHAICNGNDPASLVNDYVPFCGHILKLEIRRSFRYFVHECTSSQNKIVCSNVDIQASEPAVRLRNIKAEGRN